MKSNLLKILIAFAIVSGLTVQSAWSNAILCTVVVKEVEAVQLEESFLDPLELGDGVAIPRFIGENFLLEPAPEEPVLMVTNPDHFFRLQFGSDSPCVTILASRR